MTGSPRTADPADWASQVAERLPASDVRRLARAAGGGPKAIRRLRAQTAAPVLRDACDQLLARTSGEDPYLAGLLAGAARTTERARQHQSIDVVWTGPGSSVTTSRLTAATVTELINEARREILLVSYATRTEPAIHAALAAAASRGVEITLLAENPADNPAYTAVGVPFPELAAIRLRWPASKRPPRAALHAKIIVVDDQIALVTSANLTNRAMEANLECGILIRGGPQPRAIRDHITGLRLMVTWNDQSNGRRDQSTDGDTQRASPEDIGQADLGRGRAGEPVGFGEAAVRYVGARFPGCLVTVRAGAGRMPGRETMTTSVTPSSASSVFRVRSWCSTEPDSS
jgi:cardiolipin synthase A/B